MLSSVLAGPLSIRTKESCMYGYIYLTTNLITNKIYIGQKKSHKFLGKSYLGSGNYILNAIDKYGKDNFDIQLLCECNSAEELNEKEIYYIALYDSTNLEIGYNISHGGSVPSGIPAWNKGLVGCYTRSDEAKRKTSQSLMGHVTSDETKKKISQSNSGKKRTQEMNEANSLRNRNKVWITNGDIQKTISNDQPIPDGWYRGRLPNKVPAWNKGLTKDSDSRVKSYADKRKEQVDSGIRIGWCNCPNNKFSIGQTIDQYLESIDK